MKKTRNKVINQINTFENGVVSENMETSILMNDEINDSFYFYRNQEDTGELSDFFVSSSNKAANRKKLEKKRDSIDKSLPDILSVERLENYTKPHIKIMFDEESTISVKEGEETKEVKLGELLEKKMDEYIALTKNYVSPDVGIWIMDNITAEEKKKVKELQTEMAKIHLEITKRQAKRFYEGRYDKDVDIKSFGFTEVMKQIIKNNLTGVIKNVGFGRMVNLFGSELWKVISGKG